MQLLSIGEVARRAGVPPSTLRYYESLEILGRPQRISGQRRYHADVLPVLEIIRVAKLAGFTLREIKLLLQGFSATEPPAARWQAMARQKLTEVESLILRAQEMKRILETGLNCECVQPDECLIFAPDGPSVEQWRNREKRCSPSLIQLKLIDLHSRFSPSPVITMTIPNGARAW